MHRRSIMKGAAIGATAAMAVGLTACNVEAEGGGETEAVESGLAEGSGEITIGYINWDEAVVVTGLWERVLTDAGYTVTTQEFGQVGPLFEGLASGDVDLFLDVWLPVTHATYLDTYGDQIEDLGVWHDTAALTMAVPAYVDEVDSLADLNDHADLFGGQIIGIEPSAGLTEAVETATIPTYGLDDLTLVTSSTASMLAALDSSIAAEEPIVVTLWQPHWAYANYDLKNLEDPEGTLGDIESISAYARAGFAEDFADVAEAMTAFTMDETQLGSLEDVVFNGNGGDVAGGVDEWLRENDFAALIS